jgi:carbon monoxide dehydrogenase subunit G
MKLEQSFDIAAPLDTVWAALIDIELVAPCLPGAEVSGREDDGSYRGTFTVKLGPTTAVYNGVLRIEDVDEAAHTATLHARGTDKRGQGGATATIVNRVTAAGDGTHVEATTDMTITGRLARFGRGGMIEDISNRMLRDFASCLQAKLASPAGASEAPAPRAEPVRGIRLFFSVLFERLRRLFRR